MRRMTTKKTAKKSWKMKVLKMIKILKKLTQKAKPVFSRMRLKVDFSEI